MKLHLSLALLLALPLGMLACGESSDDEPTTTSPTGNGGSGGHHHEDPDEDACEHLQNGPFNDVTAASDTAGAPDVSAAHTAHRIGLPAAGSGGGGGAAGSGFAYQGYVAFAPDEAGEIIFFFDDDLTLAVSDSNAQPVDIEESCDPAACSQACTEIEARHAVDLTVGTFYLHLGADADRVTLVHVAADHAH